MHGTICSSVYLTSTIVFKTKNTYSSTQVAVVITKFLCTITALHKGYSSSLSLINAYRCKHKTIKHVRIYKYIYNINIEIHIYIYNIYKYANVVYMYRRVSVILCKVKWKLFISILLNIQLCSSSHTRIWINRKKDKYVKYNEIKKMLIIFEQKIRSNQIEIFKSF